MENSKYPQKINLKISHFHLEESQLNKGNLILVATTVTGKKYVVSGDHHAPTYLVEYEKSSDTYDPNNL